MKKRWILTISLIAFLPFLIKVTVNADSGNNDININEYFTNDSLREFISQYDVDQDGNLSFEEREKVQSINIRPYYSETLELSGLDVFPNLSVLSCTNCSVVDLSDCNSLKELLIGSSDDLFAINLNNCSSLEYININSCPIKQINLNSVTNLKRLVLDDTGIKEIDVSKNSQMNYLYIGQCPINSIDLSSLSMLKSLCIDRSSQISKLDLSKCTNLESLGIFDTPISSIDLSKCTKLESLDIYDTSISSIDLSKCTKLKKLYISDTPIGSIDLSKCTKLESLDIYDTSISSIDLSKCTKLIVLMVAGSPIKTIDITRLSLLRSFCCYGCKIKKLDISNNDELIKVCTNGKYELAVDIEGYEFIQFRYTFFDDSYDPDDSRNGYSLCIDEDCVLIKDGKPLETVYNKISTKAKKKLVEVPWNKSAQLETVANGTNLKCRWYLVRNHDSNRQLIPVTDWIDGEKGLKYTVSKSAYQEYAEYYSTPTLEDYAVFAECHVTSDERVSESVVKFTIDLNDDVWDYPSSYKQTNIDFGMGTADNSMVRRVFCLDKKTKYKDYDVTKVTFDVSDIESTVTSNLSYRSYTPKWSDDCYDYDDEYGLDYESVAPTGIDGYFSVSNPEKCYILVQDNEPRYTVRIVEISDGFHTAFVCVKVGYDGFYDESMHVKGGGYNGFWTSEEDDVYYFIGHEGSVCATGWYWVKGNWYYFSKNGIMQTGTVKIGNKKYKFTSKGVWKDQPKHKGWVKDPNVKNGHSYIGSGKYYFTSKGKLVTGWKKIKGKYYYFDKTTGIMVTGSKKISGKYYLFSSKGVMQKSGWKKYGSNYYYLKKSGAAYTKKWVKKSGKWYYFGSNAKMVKNKSLKIGKKTYKFDKKGICKNP